MLPTFIGGKKQKILCYVIKGDAPILIGRPLMKKPNMVIDYAADLYLSGDNTWILGPKVNTSSPSWKTTPSRMTPPNPRSSCRLTFEDHINVHNRLPLSCLQDDTIMEVKDILVKEEASHDDLSGLHPAHESLESAVVAESVRETGQSMHETPSSWTPSAMRPATQGEEGAEMTRDPTVSLHPALRIQMNRTPVTSDIAKASPKSPSQDDLQCAVSGEGAQRDDE
jgi:hypothetical protein